jgi:hypothetical protein
VAPIRDPRRQIGDPVDQTFGVSLGERVLHGDNLSPDNGVRKHVLASGAPTCSVSNAVTGWPLPSLP